MVFEGDFVGSVISSTTKSKPGTGFNVFTFPSIAGGAPATAVEIGGDLIVTFRTNPAIAAFETFLATPQAAAAWAKSGGFSTGNHNMSPSVFPDPITRATAVPVQKAKAIVFDMSDEQPASFGATAGQGEWGLFQDFLKNPKNVKGIQQKLESAAAKAYKKAK
jgi:alpha-glucoside transport system substrate-binding protein